MIHDYGIVTAYGYAKSKGYAGTEDEFATLLAHQAEVAQAAAASAEAAAESAGDAAEAVQAIQGKTQQIDANTAAIEALTYTAIKINSFAISPASAATVEKGDTVNSVTLNYSLNRAPTGLTLDNVDVMETLTTDKSGTIQLTGLALKADKTYTLVASHSSGEGKPSSSDSKTAKISFLSKVYYGLVENPLNITSEIINGLTHDVWENNVKRQYSFNNAGSTAKYVVFAIPHAKCGGIQFYDSSTGWSFFVNTDKENWTHENEFHEEVKYNVYVSDSKLSGGRNVTVEIK